MKIILRLMLLGGWLAPTTIAVATITLATITVAKAADESKPAAATQPAKPASSLDDELFKELDDGAGKPSSAAAPAAKPTTITKPTAADETTPQPASKPSAAAKPSDAKPAEAKPLPKPDNPLDAELLKGLGGDDPPTGN